MANISSINGILCVDIGSVNGNAKADISEFDSIPFCAPTPTPTPTPTPSPTPGGPTPTPTPTCRPQCCPASVCYDRDSCRNSCSCNDIRTVYLKTPCEDDPCILPNATGIFDDDTCTTAAPNGYYSQSGCYYWDGSTLVYQGSC